MKLRSFYLLLLGMFFASLMQAQTYLHDRDTTIFTCGGLYTDRGGTTGDYGNVERNIVTFCSDTTDCIQASFTNWLTEPFFDYMIVYDGPDDSYPELGRYSGAASPGVKLSSTGCLTFKFLSDSTAVDEGWEAVLSCQPCPPGPCLPNMDICRDSTCNSDFFDSGGQTGNYNNNDSLVHRICSNLGNCVQANFTSFDLENGNDTLFIYDGDSIGGTLLGAYTGNNSPGTVISPSGCMTFLFISNDSITGSGWHADITCRPCGPCLPNIGNCGDTVCTGTFFDSGGSGTCGSCQYSNNEDFVHTVCGEPGRCVTVDFSVFVTEQGFDYMNIYDGPSITSPLIATLSGDTVPPQYSASDGCLTFQWHADANVIDRGWEGQFSCIPCPCLPVMGDCRDNKCFGNFYDPGGLGSNYLPNDTTIHTICSDSGNCSQVDFSFFQLEDGNDTLYIFEGADTSGTLLGKYTGTNSPGIVTSSIGCLTFMLTTNGSVQGAGWRASIACLSCGGCLPLMGNCTDTICGGQFFDSGGLFGNYGNNESLVHTVISPDPTKQMQADFSQFSIQPGFDIFRIYDGLNTASPLIGSYTGTISPGIVTSTSGALTFEFLSNGSVTAPGWAADLSCVRTSCLPNMDNCLDSTCSGNFYDAGGIGGNYFNDAHDVHTICGDSAGQCLSISFTAFEIEDVVDYLEIYDGPTTGFSLIGRYTGQTIPGSVTATYGCLTFRFISDNNVRRDGWEANLSCTPCAQQVCLPNMANCTDTICGADFFDSGGLLGNYRNNENLVHTICADSNRNIQVEFFQFAVDLGGDTLYIYDGPTTSDPLLGAFTGAGVPPQITSTGGCMTFRFVSDSAHTRGGWDAHVRCVNSNCLPNIGDCFEQTCNSKFYDSGGPNGNYGPFEDFVHTICSAPVGCVQVTFDSVMIENGWEWLRIYDGPTTSSPLAALIIFTANPGTVTSTSGCLTFEFHSNDSVQFFGWDATLSCVPCPGCSDPVAGFHTDTTLLSVDFFDNSQGSGPLSWNWDFGDGNTSTQQNPTHVYASAGTYVACLAIQDSCGVDTICDTITVACPGPYGGFGYSTGSLTVSFSDSSNGNSINSWNWDFGDGGTDSVQNPTHTFTFPGTYNVCLTITDNCGTDTICRQVTVTCPPPNINFGYSANLLNVTFSDSSTGLGGMSYVWDFGDGNTSLLQNPTHHYATQGTYNVCLTVTDTCGTDTFCQPVIVTCPPPAAGFSVVSTLYDASFTNSSTGTNIYGYSWDFGDGNTSTQVNPTHTYAATGTYTVCLIVIDSCGADTFCSPVTITCPRPVAGFTHSTSLLGATFTDISTGNSISSWAWDFGDGNNSSTPNPTHIYTSPGTYTVCLTVTDVCGTDTFCDTILIQCPQPGVAFSATTSLLGATFSDLSTGNFLQSWLWNFGDGNTSIAQNPTHIYSNPGIYNVCLQVTDSCGSQTQCQNITVSCPPPVAGFFSASTLLTASFSDASTGNFLSTWLWDFGDGNTSTQQNPSHTYASRGTYTVCLIVSDSCGADTLCQPVTLNCPDPVAGFSATSSFRNAQFTDASTGNSISGWQWDFGDGNTSTQQNPAHTYASGGTYTVCLITTDICGQDTLCQNVTITCPDPVAAFTQTSSLLGASFSDASTGNTISSWSWDFGDGNNSSLQNPTHTYATPGTYNVCLTVTDTCGADTLCQAVTIACPPPTAGFTNTSSLLGASFSNTSTGNFISGYQWDFGDGNTSTATNPTHIYAAAGIYTVCLIVSDSCGADTACQAVSISCPPPAAGFSHTSSLLGASFTNTSTGNFITGYQWDFGDGNSSTATNPSHIYATAGTYTVCLIATDSCGSDTHCVPVVITCPPPTSNFNFSTNFLNVSFGNTSVVTGTPGYQWDFGDGNTSTATNPTHTYASAGTYTVCLIVNDSCNSDTTCKPVTVNACPSATVNFNSSSSFLQAVFTESSTVTGTATYLWDFGDGNTSTQQNPTHNYASPGTYTVCLSVTDLCGTSTLCNPVTITCPPVTASFASGSSLFTATFTDLSLGTAISAWSWDFGDGNTSTQQNPVHIYAATGTYAVCLIVTDTCETDTFCQNITISCPRPSAGFNSSSNLLGATFTDVSTGISLNSWSWDFGDGNTSTQQNPTHNYAGPGTYTVCLVVTDTCGLDTVCQPVTITCPAPAAGFTSSSTLLNASFSDASTGNNLNSWFWDFGDGNTSTLQNPTHTYVSGGVNQVCLVVSDSCGSDTACQNITITCPQPSAGFTFTSNLLGANFTDGSSGNSISGWSWDFGDGNTSTLQNPSHVYASPGTYTVCLITTDICGADTSCQAVTINCPPPVAAFSSTSNLLGAVFTDGSSGNNLNSWFWDFGDGNTSTQQNPTHNYPAAGTYNVCLIVTDSCSADTVCQNVTIVCPPPNASFTASTNLLGAVFTDGSSGTNLASWSWDFGDGSTSTQQNPTHIYGSDGTYTVCLVVTDSCSADTFCQNITLSCPDPVPAFSFTSNLLGANFTDGSSGNFISGWFWQFGDGNTSTQQNPSHIYAAPGTYNVCLTVTDSCSSQFTCQNVTITCPPPVANFTFTSNLLGASFTDGSSGNNLNSWNWSFGDGNTSSQQNPSHNYSMPGTYTVCLIVSDSCGRDTICQTVSITCPNPSASFSSSSNLLTVNYTDISIGNNISSWFWGFGDGNISTQQNPTHVYSTPGSYLVCLAISDSCGSDTYCDTVQVVCPTPTADFNFSTNLFTANFTNISSTSSSGSFIWFFGDGNIDSTTVNPSHVYASPGSYTVCLQVTDSCGTDIICKPVVISCPAPTVNFGFSANLLNVQFSDSSAGTAIQSWSWDFGDGNASAVQNPVHNYAASGTYSVCLTIMDTCGVDSFCRQVQVVCPPPGAVFTFTQSALSFNFTDNSLGNFLSGWSWDFGDGTTSLLQNPSHTYANPGSYSVCLIVTDTCGADTICQTVTAQCPALSAGFTTSGNLLNMSFTDTSSGGPVSWAWDFGDGNTSTQQNPTHHYNSAGSYQVCLVVTDTCSSDTICNSVQVVCPNPVAGFSSSGNLLTTTFTDLSTGNNVYAWSWDFGDGNTSGLQNPVHAYTAAGTYQVCLTITDSCGTDSICQGVTVTCPNPTAGFTHTTTGLSATFTDGSTGNGLQSWSWDFGDGNSASQQNPVHAYTLPGNYWVCLTVGDSCGTDTKCDSVTVDTLTHREPAISAGQIKIYPNPFRGTVYVSLDLDQPRDIVLTVMTTSGIKLKPYWFDQVQKREIELNLDDMTDGIYFLEIQAGSQRIIEKIQLIR